MGCCSAKAGNVAEPHLADLIHKFEAIEEKGEVYGQEALKTKAGKVDLPLNLTMFLRLQRQHMQRLAWMCAQILLSKTMQTLRRAESLT